MSIKLTLRDGYWYLDIKPSPCAAFKAHSRHPSILWRWQRPSA